MQNKIQKGDIKIKLDIQPGPMTPAMKTAWLVFWRRLVSSTREDLKKEREGEHA